MLLSDSIGECSKTKVNRHDLSPKWKWRREVLCSQGFAKASFIPHFVLREHKRKRSRLMDGNSSEKEGNNWWMWMVRGGDNASLCPGLCTGWKNRAQSMKVLGLGMTDEEVWVPFERIMELQPHRLWLWRQQVNLGQLMASDIQRLQCFCSSTGAVQHSKLQTASFVWAHPSHSSKNTFHQRKMNEKPILLHAFATLYSVFCSHKLWFIYSASSPLSYGAESIWHNCTSGICEIWITDLIHEQCSHC